MKPIAYLAGPDVFLPDALAVGRAKIAICARHGIEGRLPLDLANPLPARPTPADGHAIYRANAALMRACHLILANLTPFRSPSADVGTVFELGFFAAMGRPCFAYSSATRGFAERTRAMLGLAPDATRDAQGHEIEAFNLPDNLMLPGAVAATHGQWIARDEPPGLDPLAAMAAFEACVVAAARISFPVTA